MQIQILKEGLEGQCRFSTKLWNCYFVCRMEKNNLRKRVGSTFRFYLDFDQFLPLSVSFLLVLWQQPPSWTSCLYKCPSMLILNQWPNKLNQVTIVFSTLSLLLILLCIKVKFLQLPIKSKEILCSSGHHFSSLYPIISIQSSDFIFYCCFVFTWHCSSHFILAIS